MLNTFWSSLGANYSLKSFLVWCYKLGTPNFGSSSLQNLRSSIRLEGEIQIFSVRFKPGFWLGHQRKFTKGSLNTPLLYWLWAQVFVADDPSHQSEVKSSLDVSVHCCVHLSLNSDYSLSSCCWKTSLQQCCHRHAGMVLARWWGVPGFLQIGRLVFRPKCSNFVPSDQRIFISHSLKIFQVTFGKLSVGSHAYITEERRGVECCRTLWEFSSLSNAWVLSEGPPSSLSPPWLRPFYPGNWDWTASFIKCLAGSKLITFTSEGDRCAYWEI